MSPEPLTLDARVHSQPSEENAGARKAGKARQIRVLFGRRPIDADRRQTEVSGQAAPGRRVVDRDEGPGQEILGGVPERVPLEVLDQRRVLVLKSGQERPMAGAERLDARASATQPGPSSTAAWEDAVPRSRGWRAPPEDRPAG
jgi:hypothetical protein